MPIKERSTGSNMTGAVILAVFALVFGFAAGYYKGGKLQWKAGYDKGAADARASLATAPGTPPFPGAEPYDIRSVKGTVISVKENVLEVDAKSFKAGADAPVTTRYSVTVTSTTTIALRKERSAESFAATQKKFREDSAKYDAAAAAGSTTALPPMPPAPFELAPLTLKDIKTGDEVTAVATESFAGKTEFTAASLTVSTEALPLAPAVEPPAPPTP